MSDYVCPRCNYTAGHENMMRRHLNRKKICPNENDLLLTEEIKEKTLQDRIYHIPKQEQYNNNNDVKNVSQNDCLKSVMKNQINKKTGAVYMVWPREFAKHNDQVFKIGQSGNPDQRIATGYGSKDHTNGQMNGLLVPFLSPFGNTL
jgi:hypothetical protein